MTRRVNNIEESTTASSADPQQPDRTAALKQREALLREEIQKILAGIEQLKAQLNQKIGALNEVVALQ